MINKPSSGTVSNVSVVDELLDEEDSDNDDYDEKGSNNVSFASLEKRQVTPERKKKAAASSAAKTPPSALRKSKFERSAARHRDRTPVISQRQRSNDPKVSFTNNDNTVEENDSVEEKKDHLIDNNGSELLSGTDDSTFASFYSESRSGMDGDDSTVITNYTYDTVLTGQTEMSAGCCRSSPRNCMTNAVEEITGTFQDFTTAVDQVWSAFLLQDEEVSEFVKQVDEGKWVMSNV